MNVAYTRRQVNLIEKKVKTIANNKNSWYARKMNVAYTRRQVKLIEKMTETIANTINKVVCKMNTHHDVHK